MNLRDIKALVFQRSWLTLSGAATVFIVPHTLSSIEQGLFFTFLSLAAIQSIFEAGITSAFFNYVAHERAILTNTSPLPTDAERHRSEVRISCLLKMARHWFILLAIAFAILVGGFGYLFIDSTLQREQLSLAWGAPFFILISSISLSLHNLSKIPVLEGYGLISNVAKFRLRSSVFSSVVMWTIMVSGGGVWALGIGHAAQTVSMAWQITKAYKKLDLPTVSNFGDVGSDRLRWKKDIFPLQSRLAASYFLGYFIAQAVVPYVLHTQGAVAAGQIGLLLSVFSALASIIASYMYAAGPRYATLIARNDFKSLGALYQKVTFVTIAAACLVYFLLFCAIGLAKYFDLSVSHRIPDMSVTMWFVLIGLVNAYVGSAATLLRAQKKEPMLPVSAIVAFGYVTAMFMLNGSASKYLFMVFALVQLALALPLTMAVLKKSKLLNYAR
jgi:hypothetical protein